MNLGYRYCMIRYTLRCDNDHSFESWFASADAYDSLAASGMISCTHCGSTHVSKAIMAPRVTTGRKKAKTPDEKPQAPGDLTKPKSEAEAELAKLRKHVEENSDYVGMQFASEARKMHDGDAPHRPIYGEANPTEAKKLLEDGMPVAPLPFIPQRKTN